MAAAKKVAPTPDVGPVVVDADFGKVRIHIEMDEMDLVDKIDMQIGALESLIVQAKATRTKHAAK